MALALTFLFVCILAPEMYSAYRANRMEKNPADFWYKGEIGFFDNYIIPLAKKLKECNVFGASSDECLNFATQNRMEWEARGQEIVALMVEKVEEMERNPDVLMDFTEASLEE